MARTNIKDGNRHLSEMRGLGPACERDLNAAGIYTANDLQELGPEGAFLKMLAARRHRGESTKCCNAAHLYALYAAIHDIDWRDVPPKKKEYFKAFAAELRASGRFS